MLRVNNCVFGTLALATDGQTNAASSVYVIYMLRSLISQSGDCTLCIEGLGVGFGARPFADGPDAIYYVAGELSSGICRDGVCVYRYLPQARAQTLERLGPSLRSAGSITRGYSTRIVPCGDISG